VRRYPLDSIQDGMLQNYSTRPRQPRNSRTSSR
jgi:hypothetical protein